MVKVCLVILTLFIGACTADNKKQEASAVYSETALKDFVMATADSNKDKSITVMDSVLAEASADSLVFCKTVTFLERPFGNPNSAFKNDDLYAALLQAKMKSPWIDSITKVKTRERLYLLMQNWPGTIATDFTYETASGFKKKLYDIKGDYTLLYFYNPECNACKEMKAALIASPIITDKVTSGELKILAIYIDKDEKIWLNHLDDLPQDWIHGRDIDEYLYKNKVYDLRAIPTLYLLDKDKRVVLKDCVEVREIEKMLAK
ncbi:MAG: thioredoxin-like domain-containing protein [Chitinophagaceae bacterium]